MIENNNPLEYKKKRFKLNKKKSLLIAGIILALSVSSYLAIRLLVPSKRALQIITAPKTVNGKVITLKKLKPEHFIDYHNMLSNTVRKGLSWPKNITFSWTIEQLKFDLRQEKAGKTLMYVIFDNNDKKLIGCVEIREKDPHDAGQFGVWINENYWGSGRFQEASKLISEIYFATTNDDYYVAHVKVWNKRSYHALKKFGFKDAGYFSEQGEKKRFILKFYKKDLK